MPEFPAGGSVPPAEGPCDRPHLGMVLEGRFQLERDGKRREIDAGTAFHVAGGTRHHHRLEEPVRMIAFESVDGMDTSEAALGRLG